MSTYMNLEELTGGVPDTWSWSHLKTFIGQDEAAEHFYAGECPYLAVYKLPREPIKQPRRVKYA